MEVKQCNLVLSNKAKLLTLGVPEQFLNLDEPDCALLYKKLKDPMNQDALSLKIREQWQIDILTGHFDHSNFSNPNSSDNLGAHLSHYAAWSGNLPLLKTIAEKPLFLRKLDLRRRHVAYYAIVDGHFEILEWLFENYLTLMEDRDTFGINIAQWALFNQKNEVFVWLSKKFTVDTLNSADRNGNELLDYALACGNPETFHHVWALIGRPSSLDLTLAYMGSYQPPIDDICTCLIEYLTNNISISKVNFKNRQPSDLWKAKIDAQLTLNKFNQTMLFNWFVFMHFLKNTNFFGEIECLCPLILSYLVTNPQPTAKSTALCKIELEIGRLKTIGNCDYSVQSLKDLIRQINNPKHSLSEEIEIWQKKNQEITDTHQNLYTKALTFFKKTFELKTEMELLIEEIKKGLSAEPNFQSTPPQLG